MAEKKVKFHYLKSSAFRTIHIDGVFGGLSPSGFLNVAFFNERWAIPQASTYNVNEDGTLGTEIQDERVGREGITRELEVNLVMSPSMAKRLHEWLSEKLSALPEPTRSPPTGEDA